MKPRSWLCRLSLVLLGLAACGGDDTSNITTPHAAPVVHVLPQNQGCNDLQNTAPTIEKMYTSTKVPGVSNGGVIQSGLYYLVNDLAHESSDAGQPGKIQITMVIDAPHAMIYTVQTDDAVQTVRFNSSFETEGAGVIILRHTCPVDSMPTSNSYWVADATSLYMAVGGPQPRLLAYVLQ